MHVTLREKSVIKADHESRSDLGNLYLWPGWKLYKIKCLCNLAFHKFEKITFEKIIPFHKFTK